MGLSWHKVSASSNTGKLCTTHFICGNPVLSQRLTDPILAVVVSRQFRAAYWLITTKLIQMSWSEILPRLAILSLFTFELHVIEIFLRNSVLMLYIRRCVTSVQGGILADYDQHFSRRWDSPDTKFQLPQRPGNYVTLTLYVEILFWANALRTPYWLAWCHVSSGRHIGWLRPNWYTCPEMKSCQVLLSLVSLRSSHTWLRYSFQTPFWCYISVGGHPGVTSVQGGILADYDQNFSRGWDSPDTKFQLPQRPGNYAPLTLYVVILLWATALRTPYWLTWCHVSSGRHIGWLRPNWYTCPEVKSSQVWLS